MAKIKFENGQTVNFDREPTQADIEEVALKLGINKPQTDRTFAEKAGNFLGIEKFGQGIAKTISNLSGTTKGLVEVQQRGIDLTNNLQNLIKENQKAGKDTVKLEKALADQLASNDQLAKDIMEVGTGGLSNRDVAGSALSLASLAIPGAPKGSSLLTKAAVGGATGYAMDVGNKLQDKEVTTKEAFKPGVGTAIGVTLPVISNIFGKVLAKSPTALETVNQRLTPTEKKLLGSKGKEVSQLIVDNRIAGTPEQRFSKISDIYENMERKVTSKVDSTKVTFPKQSIVEKLTQVKDKYLNDPAEYDAISNKIDQITNFFQTKVGDSLTASKVNLFKRSFWKSAYNEKGNKIVSEALHEAGDVLKSALDDSIPELSKLNKEYGTVIAARKLLDVARTRAQAGIFEKAAGLTFGTSLGAGAGGVGGAGLGAILGPKAVDAAITPIRSTTAVGLNEINKLIQKIPTDKLGNLQLTKKALIQLLSGK